MDMECRENILKISRIGSYLRETRKKSRLQIIQRTINDVNDLISSTDYSDDMSERELNKQLCELRVLLDTVLNLENAVVDNTRKISNITKNIMDKINEDKAIESNGDVI